MATVASVALGLAQPCAAWAQANAAPSLAVTTDAPPSRQVADAKITEPAHGKLLAAAVEEVPGVPGLSVGTGIRLMLLNEVTSSSAKAGDRFRLRVNEPVISNGQTVVPVGTIAWGEVVMLSVNGAVGKAGKLGARLLYLDLPARRVPLEGTISRNGDGNTGGVVLAVIGFGVLGLLAKGDSARLRAGDVFTGIVAHEAAAAPTPNVAPPPTP